MALKLDNVGDQVIAVGEHQENKAALIDMVPDAVCHFKAKVLAAFKILDIQEQIRQFLDRLFDLQ